MVLVEGGSWGVEGGINVSTHPKKINLLPQNSFCLFAQSHLIWDLCRIENAFPRNTDINTRKMELMELIT